MSVGSEEAAEERIVIMVLKVLKMRRAPDQFLTTVEKFRSAELEASRFRVHVDLARFPFVRFERLSRRMTVGINTGRTNYIHRCFDRPEGGRA